MEVNTLSTLRVCCVQLAARDAGEAAATLAAALEAVEKAAGSGPDLILLPECTYPAYYLQPWLEDRQQHPPLTQALAEFCGRAARHRTWICVGMVEEADGAWYNSAFLINRRGEVVGRSRKQLLWHFDAAYFTPGRGLQVFDVDTRDGSTVTVGLLVCADFRLPELARVLAHQGASVLLDPTNWVSSGRDATQLSNPQVEFMIACRALENQVYLACANKVGLEQGSILYCGRSMLVDPDGGVLAMASSHREEIITGDLGPCGPRPSRDGRLHPWRDRRPELYGPLASSSPPVGYGEAGLYFVACVQLDLEQPGALERARNYAGLMEKQGAGLVVFGEASSWEAGEVLPVITSALACDDTAVAVTAREKVGRDQYQTMFLVNRRGVLGSYRKVHLEEGERGAFLPGDQLTVLKHGPHALGIMLGYEGLLPEVARVLTIQGAGVLLWPRHMQKHGYLEVARTRAAENRVFVAVADNLGSGLGFSGVVDPSGRWLAPALAGTGQATLAQLLMAEAHSKLVVPNTDCLRDRSPVCYRALVKD